jgi:hypothetical protein
MLIRAAFERAHVIADFVDGGETDSHAQHPGNDLRERSRSGRRGCWRVWIRNPLRMGSDKGNALGKIDSPPETVSAMGSILGCVEAIMDFARLESTSRDHMKRRREDS